jgi:H+-transporting ATPase
LFVVGTVLAGVACISSLLLLYWLLDSWRKDSVFDQLGIGGISYGQITTSIFLKVAVSDFLTLFSARAGEDWFWASRPAPILMAAAGLALSVSTLLACIWPSSRPDGIPTIGLEREEPHILPVFIWLYCIVWWIIQDAAKVYTFKVLKKYDVFQYNDTGMLPTFGTSASFYDLATLGGISPSSSSTMGMASETTAAAAAAAAAGYDHASLLMEGGGVVVDALDLSHVVEGSGASGPYTTGSAGPTSPDRSSAKYLSSRVRSGSAGALGTGTGTGGGSERHYQHPNYHHHVHHPPNNHTTLSGGFINAAVAATASHIAGAQLLYGKSRNKTPVGVQYASSASSSSSSSSSAAAAAAMAAPSSSMLSSAGVLFKQGKGN